jgi:hypothetical protein
MAERRTIYARRGKKHVPFDQIFLVHELDAVSVTGCLRITRPDRGSRYIIPAGDPGARQPDYHSRHTHLHTGFGFAGCAGPLFQEQSGYTVQTITVGSGEAMKMGKEGNADVLLVHAPTSEKTFMEAGNGTDRFLVLHNDFIIVENRLRQVGEPETVFASPVDADVAGFVNHKIRAGTR